MIFKDKLIGYPTLLLSLVCQTLADLLQNEEKKELDEF